MKLKRRHYLILEEMLRHPEDVTRAEMVERKGSCFFFFFEKKVHNLLRSFQRNVVSLTTLFRLRQSTNRAQENVLVDFVVFRRDLAIKAGLAAKVYG